MLPARMITGIGHTVAMMAMSMLDHLQPVDGMGPVGEVRIMPDPATFVPLPYAPGAGAMLADQVQPGGEPWDGCARTYLKQAIAELAAEGYAATRGVRAGVHAGPPRAGPGGRPGPAGARRRQPVLLGHRVPPGPRLHDGPARRADRRRACRPSTTTPNSATGSRRCRSGTRPRCAPPTTTCCTGRPCGGPRSAAACGRASPPSRSPTRPATAPTCTSRCATWTPTASRARGRCSTTRRPYRLSATGYHFIGGLLAHLPALAGADRGQRQQLPAPGAADVEQRLHRLRDGQPGGGDPDLLADAGRPGRAR